MDGRVFSFRKMGSGVFAHSYLCGAENIPFPIRRAQGIQAFLMNSALLLSSLMVSAAQTRLPPFFLSDYCYAFLCSFYLTFSGGNYPFFLPSGYNGCLVTYFSPGTTRPMSWRRGVHCSSHLLSHVVSSLTFRSHPSLFSDWKLSHLNSLIPAFLSIQGGTCAPSLQLLCSLSSLLQRSKSSVKLSSPSCSACGHPYQYTSDLILHSLATEYLCRSLLSDSFFLYDLLSRAGTTARLLRLHGLSPSLVRGRVTLVS